MLDNYQRLGLDWKRKELSNFSIGSIGYAKKFIELQELVIKKEEESLIKAKESLNKYKQEVETWKNL